MELNEYQKEALRKRNLIHARRLGEGLGYLLSYAKRAIPEGEKWVFYIRGQTFLMENKEGKIILKSIEKPKPAELEEILFKNIWFDEYKEETNE